MGASAADPLSARPLYGTQFEFLPRFKIVLQTNYKPKFDATDTAINDRLKLTPFLARFTPNGDREGEAEQDKPFIDALMDQHLDEVFRYILHGAIKWYSNKQLFMPQEAQKAMDEYREDQDTMEQYILQVCTKRGECNRAELYASFKTWCSENSIAVVSASSFYTALEKKGYKTKKIRGTRVIDGLDILLT